LIAPRPAGAARRAQFIKEIRGWCQLARGGGRRRSCLRVRRRRERSGRSAANRAKRHHGDAWPL